MPLTESTHYLVYTTTDTAATHNLAMSAYSAATRAIHADDALNNVTDVAPPMHLSTTFRYPSDPSLLVSAEARTNTILDPLAPSAVPHVYSRLSAPGPSRLETLLSSLLAGPSLTYASGLAAFHALLVHLAPRTVAIGKGYHGCHGVLRVYRKLTNCAVVDIHDPSSWGGLGKGDLVHLETPLNPSGEAFDIVHFAKLAHDRGAILSIDATFAPPPLLEPFKWGADYAVHSATKFLGGHSDLLAGVVVVNPALADVKARFENLWEERYLLGASPGNLESWLGARSVRTLALRVERQSKSATALVEKLRTAGLGAVAALQHASLQTESWVREQMPNGFPPVFGLLLATEDMARQLPSRLRLFHHATSLGGVESLIEWRAMSDDKVDRRLLRVSVGVEDVEDLFEDLRRGCQEVLVM